MKRIHGANFLEVGAWSYGRARHSHKFSCIISCYENMHYLRLMVFCRLTKHRFNGPEKLRSMLDANVATEMFPNLRRTGDIK